MKAHSGGISPVRSISLHCSGFSPRGMSYSMIRAIHVVTEHRLPLPLSGLLVLNSLVEIHPPIFWHDTLTQAFDRGRFGSSGSSLSVHGPTIDVFT
jgi:hypothetical protein